MTRTRMTTSNPGGLSAVNTIHDIKNLGNGFSLGKEDDGAFWLIPPKDVTVFSEAGEPLLLTAENKDEALKEAMAEIDEAIARATTNPQ